MEADDPVWQLLKGAEQRRNSVDKLCELRVIIANAMLSNSLQNLILRHLSDLKHLD